MAEFATATTLSAAVPSASGHPRFAAVLDPAWRIGAKAHGGYLLALMGRAAVDTLGADFPHVEVASAHFLRSPTGDDVMLGVEVLRRGRSAAQVEVRMESAGLLVAVALLTCGTLPPSSTSWWSAPGLTVESWSLPPEEDCVLLAGPGPGGLEIPFREVVEQRLDSAGLGFATGRPGGAGTVQGFLRLSGDDGALEPLALLMLADALPPATFDLGTEGWVPTIELTVYCRAIPAPGVLRVRQRALTVAGGRVDEVCEVLDTRGTVVATGHQLAGVRLPEAPPPSR